MIRTPHISRAAFTLVELLVAMSITILMLGLIGRIFFDTSAAIRVSMGTSAVIESSRTISDQIARDAEAMIGPSSSVSLSDPAGFLVILSKKITDVEMSSQTGTENIRSDQLVFFRTLTTTETALAPETNSTFSNSHKGAAARVWYGHLQRTFADGSDGGALGPASAMNRVGINWILGRQALMLEVTPALVPATDIYAIGAASNSVVQNDGTLTPLYKGRTDMSDQSLKNTAWAGGAIIGTGSPIDPGMADAAYHTAAYNYTFGVNRLFVNPAPTQGGSGVTAAQVAQMHPYLMGNVSDFIVEFAADTTGGSGTPDVDGAGNIKWYGYWFNNSTQGQRDPANPAATIAYDNTQPDVYEPPAGYPAYDNTGGGALLANANAAFVWRHDKPAATATADCWPILLRIRYRLHDPQGNLKTNVNGTAILGRWFEQIIKVNR